MDLLGETMLQKYRQALLVPHLCESYKPPQPVQPPLPGKAGRPESGKLRFKRIVDCGDSVSNALPMRLRSGRNDGGAVRATVSLQIDRAHNLGKVTGDEPVPPHVSLAFFASILLPLVSFTFF